VSVSLAGQNGRAIVEIHDTGIGIPAEDLPHVFERFYRVDQARTKGDSSGAGLGLAICRSIVIAHGGQMTLSSKNVKGHSCGLSSPRHPIAPA
jgi:signal transduction histidine kinase